MKQSLLARSLPAVLLGTVAALNASGGHAASNIKTFKGATEDARHGPVGVTIGVKGRKIVTVTAKINPLDDGRSPFLQENAIPILKKEALKAQSAKIEVVSGATETSEAYIASLQSAIKKAKKAGALK